MAPLTLDQVDTGLLETFLAERGPVHRVGRYFEQLVHYWLAHVRGVELLGAGLQVRPDKRTLGELDFVYRDEEQQVVHCEVTVKFFLHHPRRGTSHFPGPNASDNFESKIAKLFDQQLELSRRHFPSVERRDAIVKGMAFYNGAPPAELPPRMSPTHAVGSWIRSTDCARLRDRDSTAAAVVTKPHWLAPQVDADLQPIDDLVTDLERHFANGDGHPLMVSLRDATDRNEIERIFVVSPTWPVT